MLVIASIGWALVTVTLWAASVWLIEREDDGSSKRREVRR